MSQPVLTRVRDFLEARGIRWGGRMAMLRTLRETRIERADKRGIFRELDTLRRKHHAGKP